MAATDVLEIRPMTAGDVAQVAAIEVASFSSPWRQDTFHALLERDTVELLTAVDGGTVVGYAVVWCVLDQGELSNVAVAPSHRRRGLGRRLLQRVIEVSGARGVRHLFLEVRVSNSAARALYHDFGFEELGRRKGYYDDPPEDAILMQATLGGPYETGDGDEAGPG